MLAKLAQCTRYLYFGHPGASSNYDLALPQLRNLWVVHPQRVLHQLRHIYLPVAAQQEVVPALLVLVASVVNLFAFGHKMCQNLQRGALVLSDAGVVDPFPGCVAIVPHVIPEARESIHQVQSTKGVFFKGSKCVLFVWHYYSQILSAPLWCSLDF